MGGFNQHHKILQGYAEKNSHLTRILNLPKTCRRNICTCMYAFYWHSQVTSSTVCSHDKVKFRKFTSPVDIFQCVSL